MRYMFSVLALLCVLAGCFGETPSGAPALHQFAIALLCTILAVVLWHEHIKIKKGSDQDGI